MHDHYGSVSIGIIININFSLVPSSSPHILSVDLIKSTSCVVKWELPPLHEINGNIRYILLNVTEVETSTVTSIRVYNRAIKKIEGLHPYYNYMLTVAMMTVSIGPFSQPVEVQTEEAGTYSGTWTPYLFGVRISEIV